MQEEVLFVDFDDVPSFQIMTNRYNGTATILGVSVAVEAAMFGFGKVHAKMKITGQPEDVARFIQFVHESLALLENEKR
jgi:hypothetical protein